MYYNVFTVMTEVDCSFVELGKDGEYFLVKWNESKRATKRTYVGFRKISPGVMSFGTTQNHFLVVGKDSQIELWDMDNINLLTFTYDEGGLPNLSYVRFNKQGNLFAMTTIDNGFKILVIVLNFKSLETVGTSSFDPLRTLIVYVAIKASSILPLQILVLLVVNEKEALLASLLIYLRYQ